MKPNGLNRILDAPCGRAVRTVPVRADRPRATRATVRRKRFWTLEPNALFNTCFLDAFWAETMPSAVILHKLVLCSRGRNGLPCLHPSSRGILDFAAPEPTPPQSVLPMQSVLALLFWRASSAAIQQPGLIPTSRIPLVAHVVAAAQLCREAQGPTVQPWTKSSSTSALGVISRSTLRRLF